MSEDQWGKYLRAKEPGVREKAYAWKTASLNSRDVFGTMTSLRMNGCLTAIRCGMVRLIA